MNIKKLRIEKGLYQNQLARFLNVSTSTYNKYEHKILEPNISTLVKLANFYNVSMDYLLDRPHSTLGYAPEKRIETLKQIANASDTDFENIKLFTQAIINRNKTTH